MFAADYKPVLPRSRSPLPVFFGEVIERPFVVLDLGSPRSISVPVTNRVDIDVRYLQPPSPVRVEDFVADDDGLWRYVLAVFSRKEVDRALRAHGYQRCTTTPSGNRLSDYSPPSSNRLASVATF